MPQALILAIKVSCYTAVGRFRGPTAYVAFWVMPITHIQQIFLKTFLKYCLCLSSRLPAVEFWLSETSCYYLMSQSRVRLDINLHICRALLPTSCKNFTYLLQGDYSKTFR